MEVKSEKSFVLDNSNSVVWEIKLDSYVDKNLDDENTVTKAMYKYREDHSVMSKASMDLTKIESSCKTIADFYGYRSVEFKYGELSILDLNMYQVDVFKFSPSDLHSDVTITKALNLEY